MSYRWSDERKLDVQRQNSSMSSPDRRPQIYRPLNRLNKPTHERKASNDGGTSGWRSSVLQFSKTAMRVRPACVS